MQSNYTLNPGLVLRFAGSSKDGNKGKKKNNWFGKSESHLREVATLMYSGHVANLGIPLFILPDKLKPLSLYKPINFIIL
jgi:hypothetical protein